MDVIVAGLWLGLVFNAVPGAVFTESLRRGVTGGFRPAFAVQVGSLVGDAVWALLGLAGVGAILTQPRLAVPLTVAGCLVLISIGLLGLRSALGPSDTTSRPEHTTPRPEHGSSTRGPAMVGAAMSIGNVWNVVYWAGAGGAVAGSLGTDAPLGALSTFFVAFMASSVLWCFISAGFIAIVHRGLGPKATRSIEVAASAALVVLGIYLAADTLP